MPEKKMAESDLTEVEIKLNMPTVGKINKRIALELLALLKARPAQFEGSGLRARWDGGMFGVFEGGEAEPLALFTKKAAADAFMTEKELNGSCSVRQTDVRLASLIAT